MVGTRAANAVGTTCREFESRQDTHRLVRTCPVAQSGRAVLVSTTSCRCADRACDSFLFRLSLLAVHRRSPIGRGSAVRHPWSESAQCPFESDRRYHGFDSHEASVVIDGAPSGGREAFLVSVRRSYRRTMVMAG